MIGLQLNAEGLKRIERTKMSSLSSTPQSEDLPWASAAHTSTGW